MAGIAHAMGATLTGGEKTDIATEQERSLAMSSVHDASSFSCYKKG